MSSGRLARGLREGSIFLAFVLVANLAGAQEIPGGRSPRADVQVKPNEGIFLGPIVFSPSVFLSWAWDTNILDVEDGQIARADDPNTPANEELVIRPKGDSITVARSRLGFKLPFSHSYTSLVWTPSYRDYGTTGSPLHTTHQVAFETRLNFSNGSFVTVKDDFIDSFIDLKGPADAEDRQFSSTPYRKNNPEISLDWPMPGGWGVAAVLERTDFAFARTEVVDFVSQATGERESEQGLFDFFDYTANEAEISGYRNVGRFNLFASARFGLTGQDRSKFNESRLRDCLARNPGNPDTCDLYRNLPDSERITQVDASVGMKGRLLRKTEGEVELGYTSWRFREGKANSFVGIDLSARVTHTINSKTLLFAHIERTPLQASGIYTGYYLFDRLGFNIQRKLSTTVTAKVGVDLQRTSVPSSTEARGFHVSGATGDVQVLYRPSTGQRTGPLALIVMYRPEIQRSSSREQGVDVDGQRVGVSLQYGWF